MQVRQPQIRHPARRKIIPNIANTFHVLLAGIGDAAVEEFCLSTIPLSTNGRTELARYGSVLEIATITWAAVEASVALWSASRTGSLSLAGFGWDSLIEVISAVAVWWRMHREMDHHRRHQAERVSLKISGTCLLMLAAFILYSSCSRLIHHDEAQVGTAGIVITAFALVLMPLLSREKRKIGRALSSNAMMTDAKQTDFCMYQAAIVLIGIVVQRVFGIAWTDSVAALILVPLLIRASILSYKGQHCCSH
jgi:divalent metal cation (Fe/Co/Zn/Cd) transporter